MSPNYVQKNYNEDVAANIAAKKPAGDWPDLVAEYEALSNPATALTQWQTVTAPTDGETLAHEYAWITSLQALGQIDSAVTANTPYYAVFNHAGTISHVAFNPSTAPVTVAFSDNTTLTVPADTMASDSPLVTSFPSVQASLRFSRQPRPPASRPQPSLEPRSTSAGLS